MAENKEKKYVTKILVPLLLILAAAVFIVVSTWKKQSSYVSFPTESGYIDTQAVYNSNKNYAIVKKEIAEYESRIDKELAVKLANEHNEQKRTQLKLQAEKEKELYAQALLQDIDEDIDNAINEVAENKDLKRVYIRGSIKKDTKNMTQAVITELNMTLAKRLDSCLRQQKEEKTVAQPKIYRHVNFDSYPVAMVPEQGITKEASGNLISVNKYGSIVAETQERRANNGNAIVKGCKQVFFAGRSFILARNTALAQMQMRSEITIAKNHSAAKPVIKQCRAKKQLPTVDTDIIASCPSRITFGQISELYNASSARTYAVATVFQKHLNELLLYVQDTMLSLYKGIASCQNMHSNVQTKEAEIIQTNKTASDKTIRDDVEQEPVTEKQQAVSTEIVKATESGHDADTIQQISKKQTKKANGKIITKTVKKSVVIQVAACINKNGAERAIRVLRSKQIPAQLCGIKNGDRQWWCVRIAAADNMQADNYKRRLATMGYASVLVH